jgi:hypothetical protein
MSLEMSARAAATPVRQLAELPELERRIVAFARLWRAGRAGQARLDRALAARAGPAGAAAALARIEEMMCLLLLHGRRPLRLGPVGAAGVLGDECVLARLVTLAAEGAREEAVLMSALMIRVDFALELARLAEGVGLAVARGRGTAA